MHIYKTLTNYRHNEDRSEVISGINKLIFIAILIL